MSHKFCVGLASMPYWHLCLCESTCTFEHPHNIHVGHRHGKNFAFSFFMWLQDRSFSQIKQRNYMAVSESEFIILHLCKSVKLQIASS